MSSKSYGEEKLITTVKKNEKSQKIPNEKVKKYRKDESWAREVNEFVHCIINNKDIKSGSSVDALNVMKLIDKIYKADKSWKKKYNL